MAGVERLKGSITPIVTPFKGGEVDYETYAKLVDWQIGNGCHGVLVNGTTSEPSTLTVDERNRLVDVAIEAADKRVPVVAATGSQSHAETIALTTHADRAGVDALLIVTPYYIRPPQRGLVEYYSDLGSRTQLPMMIYHIPGRAAVTTDLQTVKAIKERVPHLVGMKHAVNDMGFVTQMLGTFGTDWRVFVGLEELSFPMLAVGACGLMNAVGNLAPRRVADLYEAVEKGDMATGRQLHFDLFELNQSVFFDTNPIPIKYMMKRMGLISNNEHRLPMVPATHELEERLDRVLAHAGLI
ncbi:4-hydroxy-tetrahydrodipicolinate synthase [Paraburkholderia steynii]|uniref:4-hydroxy-tetrahydrodipicolinate synthase n=1 Tax=Paraburkholderia steynii TaxID=1245441 RepID=A0A7Z7B228_9BURK|nr:MULTISPECIES: 4-hydroxy-tetrahydrodipicolinate synthase [Paraburkholderia]EUC18767.1 Dihydrodipicolinate synthase [Burkholderia sp. BT03]SDH24770.1 4-hydroxy-tetrahydrodipicolinate synthase [Paraburkholderia steynii]SKC61419.1 4-hydroxy-tetrahydrodipicolinate synthase [Paraburkholderia hospita]